MTTKKVTASAQTQLIESFKITPTDAEQILASFAEPAELIEILDTEFIEVSKIKDIDEESCAMAKELRLRYVKARTASKEIHDRIKASVLLRSKAIDGAYNIFKLKTSEREEALMNVEKHFERIEEEKRDGLLLERAKLLEEIGLGAVDMVEHLGLGEMPKEVWDSFYSAKKAEHKARIDAEKKAEADRIAAEKADKAERARIEKENEDLKKEQIAKQKELEKERIAGEKLIKARVDEMEKERAGKQKAEKELADKKAEEEESRIIIEKSKAKEAVARKNKKYSDFLKKHSVTEEELKKGRFLVLHDGDEFRLYEFIDSVVIS